MKNLLTAAAFILTAALPAHKAMACSHVFFTSNFYLYIDGVSQEQRNDLKPVFADANGNVIGLADFNGGFESESTAAGKFTLTLNYKSEVLLTQEVDVKKGLCYTPPVDMTIKCATSAEGSLSCTAN